MVCSWLIYADCEFCEAMKRSNVVVAKRNDITQKHDSVLFCLVVLSADCRASSSGRDAVAKTIIRVPS